jgi:hypothetical protein
MLRPYEDWEKIKQAGGFPVGPGLQAAPGKQPPSPRMGPDGLPVIGPGLQAAPAGPQVTLPQPGNPYTYSSRQTDAAANYAQAQAHRQGDPRAANKAYQRAGLSSSKGTQAAGAADASQAYAANMAASEQARMNDAYSNANVTLNSDAMRNQFGQALAGLSEEAAQMQYMQNMRNMQNATSFMGNLFGTMTQPLGNRGGGSGLLGQLLGGLM